jgi:protein tyrosine/serine phosphatase
MTPKYWFLRSIVLAVVLAAACGGAPSQQAEKIPPPAQRAMGTRMAAKGIPNFGQVSPNLYRGALPSTEGLQGLKKMGVDIVVDLRGGHNVGEETTVAKLGMQYVSIPSHCPFPKDETFARFLKVIRENPGKKVFVHCRLGDDRTGMAVASYRMAEEGWSANDALKEMKVFGFSAVHRAICPGMESYEESFPERLQKNTAFRDLPPHPDPAAK